MLKIVTKEDRREYEFNLSELQKKLEINDYCGTITLVYQNGQIVLIREERTIKPGNFDRFF